MLRKIGIAAGFLAVTFVIGIMVGEKRAEAQAKNRIFEIRTYTTNEGKMPALVKRFKDHELPIFEKNGMKAIFYSVAAEAPKSDNTFIYVLAHADRETARKSWAAFLADPEFRVATQESDAGGVAVSKVDSIFVNPTDFSPLK